MPDIFDDFLDELKRRQGGAPDGNPASGGPATEDAPDEIRQRRRGAGGGQPPRPPRPRVVPTAPRGGSRWTWIVIAVAFVVLVFLSVGVGFWTDVLWYRSVGFEPVLWTRVVAGGGLFLLGTVVALLVFLGNLALANRLAPPGDGTSGEGLAEFLERLNQAASTRRGAWEVGPRPVAVDRDAIPDLVPAATLVIVGISVLVALTVGGAVGASWETVLLWVNRVPFAPSGAPVTDPVFGRDISWFLFELPFLRTIQSIFNTVVLAGLLVAAARYLAGLPRGGLRIPTPVRVHLAALGGLYLLSIAFGYQLDKYELVYSNRGVATGVSYTDANAQFLAYDLLTIISGLAAAFLVGAAFTRWTRPLGLALGAWFIASIVVGRLYPEAIQRFTVDPNPLAQERPYIANNIAMTRLAYGLGGWETSAYGGDAPLTQAQIDENGATFRNARLWDYRPLGDTLDQLQTVRRYYDFVDVDTDRYPVGDEIRQIMLSARELDLANNPDALGWLNERVIFTHGIGAVMVPVNEVTAEGQPVLFIKNLPPVSSQGAPTISQPRIYFGEKDNGYVIVRAQQPEFDYPQVLSGSEQNILTHWSGTTGIGLDTTLNRLLFALRYGDLDLLISSQVTADSQILVHRTIKERLGLLAPFLRYDKDPYLVIGGDGRLVYVQDAFTTSDRFPNAEPFDPGSLEPTNLGSRPFDYIRNSVKVVMDAYDGTMRFYIADPSDPIIRAYAGIFPDLFRPLAELPADLAPHLRYPEEQFNVQARMYGRYHVTDPETFFNANDLWTVPTGQTNEQSLPSEAYYVIMRMPGEAEPEFLLLQPMVPTERPNMISWVAARNDAPNYGAVRVFRFPSDTTVLGPAQIEARIDQDPTISAQITLWSQAGSTVIRGNLIVVPVGDSLLYLQPVYLQSTSAKFPEFQRIVVASPTTVVWARTLRESLQLLLQAGGQPGASPTPGATPTGAPPTPVPSALPGLPADVGGLIDYANLHFELAQAALRAGDFARYGEEIELVKQALARLDQLAGPSPSP